MNPLTKLSFQVEPLDARQPAVLALTPVLDGIPLTRLVDDFEKAQGFDAAGGYAGLVPAFYNFGALDFHFLANPYEIDASSDWIWEYRYLLGCNCGELSCWPLVANVSKSSHIITWDGFLQPHRPARDYSTFGPFHFRFEQYKAAVHKVAKQFYDV